MTYYIAIVEDAGSQTAIGVWFPDLPGCFSAGDSVDEAMLNAPDAIDAYREALAADGRRLPPPRTLTQLKADAAFAADARGNLIVLIPIHPAAAAAE